MSKFTGGSKLKPAYIKKLYKKFQSVDKNNSGTIDYPEFLDVLEQQDSFLMQRMFELFDSNKSGETFSRILLILIYRNLQSFCSSGVVELKEFIIGMSNFTSANQIDKLKFAFLLFDEDSSGSIEVNELKKILRRCESFMFLSQVAFPSFLISFPLVSILVIFQTWTMPISCFVWLRSTNRSVKKVPIIYPTRNL